MKAFKIEITEVEKGPKELDLQLPIVVEAVKELPGKDRSDYILAKIETPIFWVDKKKEINKEIEFMVLCAKYKGQHVNYEMKNMSVAVAYVIDNSLADDAILNLKKCEYVAIVKATSKGKWNLFG